MHNITEYNCTCDKWQAEKSKLVSEQQFSSIHGIEQCEEQWLFCPFCGKAFE